MSEKCDWVRCTATPALTYLKKALCPRHWRELCERQERGDVEGIVAELRLPRSRVESTINPALMKGMANSE